MTIPDKLEEIPFPTELLQQMPASSVMSDERHSDCLLRYSYQLPVNWVQAKAQYEKVQSSTSFVELSRFMLPDSKNAKITTAFLYLERECGPSEWLAIDQKRDHLAILNRRDTYTSRGALPDVLSSQGEGKEQCIHRTTVIKDGRHLIRLECTASLSEYPKLADDFFVAISTFQFLQPANQRAAEELVEYEIGDQQKISLPRSWQHQHTECRDLSPIVKELNGSMFEFDSAYQGDWTGTLVVAVVENKEQTAQRLREAYLSRMQKNNLTYSRLNVTSINVKDSKYQAGWLFDPEMEGGKYTCPFLLLENSGHVVLVSLVGPSECSNPEWQAINKRAFEIVRDSLTCED